MTNHDLDKHYQREVKMQTWRIVTPILSIISPVIVGILVFFMVRMISQFDERNDSVVHKIDVIAEKQEIFKIDTIQKYAELRYRCCSEIK